ncbi:MAG: S-layer homology domain-containing protein [Oscillospiraceae bacterium]|nr:S-layer homology domain-containing protein [Oscillospiraceae bacterium]
MKKKLSIGMVLALLLTMLPAAPLSYGSTLSDIRGHWAEPQINEAVQKGFVRGYPDGTFQPDRAVTRAEFAHMVNNALGNTGTASITFVDVPNYEWYYSDVSRAVAAAYAGGYEDSTFKPDNPITRQEAAVIISRIVPTYGSSGNLYAFPDHGQVGSWAQEAFQKVNGKGYMGAYDDGLLHPLDQLTRAQTAKILCDILNHEIIAGDPSVRSSATLRNTIYPNGVTIHRDLGDGDATIENCIILGNLTVNGGGDRSVTVNHSRVSRASVEKNGGAVRLLVRGESVLIDLTAANTAIIETSNLAGGLYGDGIGSLRTLSNADITLRGTFPRVTADGAGAKLDLVSGSITHLIVSAGARDAEIHVAAGATVSTADVNARSDFQGTGTISRMNVNVSGVTYETKPRDVQVARGVDAPEEGGGYVRFSPANGATGVSRSTNITLTFHTEMELRGGGDIRPSDIDKAISLHRDSANGAKVDFDGSINNRGTVITLDPDGDLRAGERYYVVLERNAFEDAHGEANPAQTIYFNTGGGSGDSRVTFDPKNGDTGVSTTVHPRIQFTTAIELVSGQTMTDSRLQGGITFKRNNSSGTNVPFTASINSNNRVTIVPDSALTNGQYYLEVQGNYFQTASGKDRIAQSSATWTVGTTQTFTVTFNANGGTYAGTPPTTIVAQSVPSGGTVNPLPTAPTNPDYTFGNWWTTDAPSGGTQFTASTLVTNNITVYARWTPVTPPYRISLNLSNVTFPSAVEGYAQPPVQTIIITNTGTQPTGELTVQSTGNFTIVGSGNIASIEPNQTRSFEVRPLGDLDAETYNGSVKVSNESNNISATATMTFTVTEPTEP